MIKNGVGGSENGCLIVSSCKSCCDFNLCYFLINFNIALRYSSSTNGTDTKQMKQCANTLAGSLVNIR